MKKIAKKEYHPAIEAAVNYWRGVLSGGADPGKLAVFGEALSGELAGLLDLHEGFIELRANAPGGLLLKALKKAKLPFTLLPQNGRMTVSSSVVMVFDRESVAPRMIWKAPMSRVSAPPKKVTGAGP